ncbi:MAG TPA: hypothetical protein VM115_14955 [Vicinamibacterales bacterium]|nr:hypothetical protein [Vicinamibacterales bacterium]
MRAVVILILLAFPEWAFAQDKWFAADKAKHFGAGAALAGGAYAVSVPVTKRKRWRIAIGTTVGLAAAGGKELRDGSRKRSASWRDIAWTAGGTATGVLLAWVIDKAGD